MIEPKLDCLKEFLPKKSIEQLSPNKFFILNLMQLLSH